MTKMLWVAAVLAAFGLILLLTSTSTAHPGVDAVVIEGREDGGGDTDHSRAAVAEDKEVDLSDAS